MGRRRRDKTGQAAATPAEGGGAGSDERALGATWDVLRESGAGSRPTGGAILLALAAMRAGATALAAVRGGRCLVRNERWLELASARGPAWRPAGAGAGAAHGTLERAALREARALGPERVRTLRLERRGGEGVVEMHLERAHVGVPELVLVMISDVTEQVRADRELARAREAVEIQERLRAVGELASGIAHDLNNTLHALRLRLSRLAGCVAACADHRDDLRAVERIASDAAVRVRRLQDVAHRREDVPDERVDLPAVVARAARDAGAQLGAPGSPIPIEVDVPALPPVVGSAAELSHVLVSLFLNAHDAMPRGGRITVGGATTEGGDVELTVCDEGPGIPAGNLERIFDPFFTTKGRRGTGLGLALATGVMRRLGGSIRAENRPGGGARFVLRFPRTRPAAPARAAPRPAVEPVVQRILVVDDDPDNLDAMRLVLSERGHHVDVTQSGLEAAARVEQGERYDTVVCDLGLGDTTGWEVAARIAAAAPGTRILLVTGWAEEIPANDPRRRHVARVLAKPLDLEDLQDILGGAPPRGSRAQAEGPARAHGAQAPPAPSPRP